MSTYDKILDSIMNIKIIDSHEHLPGREDKQDMNADVLAEYLIHYFNCDLLSAGLKPEELEFARDYKKPLMERWKTVEPYWKLARNTGYGRALDTAAQAIYGIERIDGNTIEELNHEFQKARRSDKSHYNHVLKEMSNIEYSVLDSDLECDRKYFRSAIRVTRFVMPESWLEIEEAGREAGIVVTCFDDWLEVCTKLLDDAFARGAITLKCTLAYERTLSFVKPTRHEAEAAFNEMLPFKIRPTWENGNTNFPKAFQDYMMHYVLRYANRRGLVIQVHTGFQEGNRNDVARSDPSLLTNLFIEYPNVKFDLFHIGYPYQHVMSVLGKMFPNVYVDMCWAHIISPAACVQTLDDWLDSMSVSKIIAFGGDYILVDGVYAHQLFARQDISRALSKKVDHGIIGIDEAIWMADRMFYQNPKALYGE